MRLENLLSTQGLVKESPVAAEIVNRGVTGDGPAELFYGETYDEAGTPIDSLKYYLFVAELSDAVRREGGETNPSILVADTAACRNVGDQKRQLYMRLGLDRARTIERVNEVYSAGLNIVRMSEYVDSPGFIEERREIIEFCQNDPELMGAVENTVPESKLEVEREKGFMYSFDEIATILDIDVKVGPPRENLYDDVARTIAAARGRDPLMSLYLQPTFPLGKDWSYFFRNDGIESHGITAYKAASKRLQGHRIILGRTTVDYAKGLVDTSFISHNPELPNPVLDLGIIAELARKRVEGDTSEVDLSQRFYNGDLSQHELRKEAVDKLAEFVLAYF